MKSNFEEFSIRFYKILLLLLTAVCFLFMALGKPTPCHFLNDHLNVLVLDSAYVLTNLTTSCSLNSSLMVALVMHCSAFMTVSFCACTRFLSVC